jgi:purine-binding chemotaxis protein CheW
MTEQVLWGDDETIEFVSISAGGQGLCVPITSVLEIRRWTTVTQLPYSDQAVLGVMNLRGAVIPIIDLAAKLDLGKTEVGTRNVVVIVAVEDRIVGLLVDSASEILSVKGEAIRPNPTQPRNGGKNLIIGLLSVGDTMLRVLDLTSPFEDLKEEAA